MAKTNDAVQNLVGWSDLYGLDLSSWTEYISLWFWNEYLEDAFEVRFENIELLNIDFLRMNDDHLGKEEIRQRIKSLNNSFRIKLVQNNLKPLYEKATVFAVADCGRIDFAAGKIDYFSQRTALAAAYWHQAPEHKFIRPNIDVLAKVENISQEPSMLYEGEYVKRDLELVFSDAELIDIDLSRWEKMLEIWVISDLMWSVIFPDDQVKSRNPILRIQFHNMHTLRIDFLGEEKTTKTRWNISEMSWEEKESLIDIKLSGITSKISIVCEKITFSRGSDSVLDTLFPKWENREGLARPDQEEMAVKVARYNADKQRNN